MLEGQQAWHFEPPSRGRNSNHKLLYFAVEGLMWERRSYIIAVAVSEDAAIWDPLAMSVTTMLVITHVNFRISTTHPYMLPNP